jgi:hypothetical protein
VDAPRRELLPTALRILLGLLVLGGAAWFASRPHPAAGTSPAPSAGTRAEPGRGYYLYVAELEVEATKADGKAWDAGGGAPDLAYEIRWRGVGVFSSTTVQDALLARWSLASLGLHNLGGGVSKEAAVRAARVHVAPGEAVEIVVRDADLAFDDEVARWSVPLDRLEVGRTEVLAPGGRLRRAVLELRPFDEVSTGDLLR